MRLLSPIALLVLVPACGASTPRAADPDLPPEVASASASSSASDMPPPSSGPGVRDPDEAKAAGGGNPCMGLELDLMTALSKAACEVPAAKDEKARDVKDRLEVKVTPVAPKIKPGEKVDVIVSFRNKGKGILPLRFVVNPLPRFELEVYDAKKRRVDVPSQPQPRWPDGKEPAAGEEKTAEVSLPENGVGRVTLTWNASKMKWAPSKAKGAAMGASFPKEPAGPLGKGKYTLKVLTPLTGVQEGLEHEVSAPSTVVEVSH